MSIIEKKSVLTGLCVRDAMRRVVALVPLHASIEEGTRCILKFRANAILIINERRGPVGVVSKTNVMGAYYAGLPIDTPLEAIMMPEPLFCSPGDSLESALDLMRKHQVHRIYVMEEGSREAEGVLAYYDILGLLYRYCHKCERNILRLKGARADNAGAESFLVQDVMRTSVQTNSAEDTLLQVMEGLELNEARAVLIRDVEGIPVGVLSVTDLLLAYRHGISSDAPARSIMHSPVRTCDACDPLVLAIQRMLFPEVQRLFVHRGDARNIVGVLSLADAARARSGSCKACMTSRIEVAESSY